MEAEAVMVLGGLILLTAVIGFMLLRAARAAPPGRRVRAVLAQIGSMLLTVFLVVLVIAGITVLRVGVRFIIRGGSLD